MSKLGDQLFKVVMYTVRYTVNRKPATPKRVRFWVEK